VVVKAIIQCCKVTLGWNQNICVGGGQLECRNGGVGVDIEGAGDAVEGGGSSNSARPMGMASSSNSSPLHIDPLHGYGGCCWCREQRTGLHTKGEPQAQQRSIYCKHCCADKIGWILVQAILDEVLEIERGGGGNFQGGPAGRLCYINQIVLDGPARLSLGVKANSLLQFFFFGTLLIGKRAKT
jgi:hypothetical protein